MSRTSRTKYAILGLLAEDDKSGYDIKKTIEREIKAFWHESYGQIYPTLKKLQEAELIAKSDLSDSAKGGRQVYTITEAGRLELRHWLEQPPELQPERIEILLKLYFGQNASVSTQIDQMEAYRAEMIKQRLALQHTLSSIDKGYYVSPTKARYVSMTCRYGIHSLSAVIDWCDETLEILHTSLE